MIIFATKPQFNPNTGEPAEPRRIHNGFACDYCGHIYEDGYEIPDPTYKVEESGNVEAGWHEDRLKLQVDGEEFDVDLYDLFSTHPEFLYCQEWINGSNCTMRMVTEWFDARKVNGPSDLGGLRELAYVMYQCRYNVIKKLQSEGYTVDQLGLVARE